MLRVLILALVVIATAFHASAQGPADTELLASQRKALDAVARYDGHWKGEATVYNPDGTRLQLIQTERVGAMLDGTIRVIEGRGYLPDGAIVFNALAVVSYTPRTGKYNFRSYAQGYAGDYPLDVGPEGFTWSINMGPAVMRYTSTVKDGTWVEVGERIVPGQPPEKTFEMRLKRIGSTEWPSSGAVAR